MKRLYLFVPRLIAVLALLLTLLVVTSVKGEDLGNASDECADILIVFARGSSQNSGHQFLGMPFDDDFEQVEAESAKFFQSVSYFLDHNYPNVTYKAQSIHDFPDKYHPRGYPASGIFSIQTANNAINADVPWWPWGDYQDSVQGGKEETLGYVKDEIARCPNQKILMGGYSQGAQVIGESLFEFSAEERSNIAGVALFGDPKYIGAKASSDSNSEPEPYPWKRGTASSGKKGIAEARDPYVPEDMEYKTVSWCFEDDFVCAGEAAFTKKVIDKAWNGNSLGGGHTRYSTLGIRQAADELLQRISPQLYALDGSLGGINKDAGPEQPIPTKPVTRPIDVMFLVNVSADMDDALGTIRFHVDDVIHPISQFFPASRFGVADISEISIGSDLAPRYNFYQDLSVYSKPDSPVKSSVLSKNLMQKVAYGGGAGGGVDQADPLGIAVEKTSLKAAWNPEATKHIILITDRPAKDPHTFNICNSGVWNNLQTWDKPKDPLSCIIAPSSTSYSVESHPELCETALLIITKKDCTLDIQQPIYLKNITRELDDSISVAQAQRVAVSIIVPHEYHPPDHSEQVIDVGRQLEYFAKATSGLFLKYDTFSRAEFSDVIWRVLNHKPQELVLAYQDALSVLEDGETIEPARFVTTKTGMPTVFDVSTGGVLADKFKWDFDGDGEWDKETQTPNVEHTFTQPVSNALMKAVAFKNDEKQVAMSWPLTVEQNQENETDNEIPRLPDDISARLLDNGDVLITWTSDGQDNAIAIKDPETGLPVVVAPEEDGQILIPKYYYSNTQVDVFAANELQKSDAMTLSVQTNTEKAEVINSKVPLSESAPWSQFLEGVAGGLLTIGTTGQHYVYDDVSNKTEGRVAADSTSVTGLLNTEETISAIAEGGKTDNESAQGFIPILLAISGIATLALIFFILRRLF